ncbi:hypothetical protein SAY86_015280 [Trapa natans]|uniref:Uncharacterized protein n=1 Tax=Trapa natans TaxID=22666 RepID=A0AAN7KQ08_TRANT|nr:hypothetical protein SAY86_015280 [Trapa natans]
MLGHFLNSNQRTTTSTVDLLFVIPIFCFHGLSPASHIYPLIDHPILSYHHPVFYCHMSHGVMAGQDHFVSKDSRAAPPLLSLAAALSSAILLLGAMMLTTGADAAELQPAMSLISNATLYCSRLDGEDGECLAIGEAQPELEGFEMTADLGSGGVVYHRSLLGSYKNQITGGTNDRNQAGCGRMVSGKRYYSCTTNPNNGPKNPQRCSALNRNNPCP